MAMCHFNQYHACFYLLIQSLYVTVLNLSMLSVCLEMYNNPSCFLPKSPEAQPQLNLLKAVLGAGENIRISKHTLLQSTYITQINLHYITF